MRLKHIDILLTGLTLLVLYGCEYQLNELNFVDIEKPAPTHEISLSLNNQFDTINIFTVSNIFYSFNTGELEAILVKFTLGDKSWEFTDSHGSFEISPVPFEDGYHELTAKIYVHSGTGSIGDMLGTEGYYFTTTWIIKIGGDDAPDLDMSYSFTDEGWLRIDWEKCSQPNFKKYKLTLPDWSEHVFENPDVTYYIDKNYVCGYKVYTLECEVYSRNNNISTNKLGVNIGIDLQFETIGLDSLRIFWSNPLAPCTYTLIQDSYGQTVLLENETDTSVTVAYPGFSKPLYLFVVRPEGQISTFDYNMYLSKRYEIEEFATFGYYEKVDYEYSIKDNTLIISSLDSVFTYNNELGRISSKSLGINGPDTDSDVSYSSASDRTAVLYDNTVYIFSDYSLTSPEIINLNSDYNGIRLHEKMLILKRQIYGISYTDRILILNIDTRDTLAAHDFGSFGILKTSSDGRYIAYISNDKTIYMYEVKGSDLELKFSFPSTGTEDLEFNEYNSSEFYIKEYNTNMIELRNSADNSVISGIDLTISPSTINSIVIYNTDPVSGYLLISRSGKEYLILDMHNESVKLQIKSDFYMNAKLFDGRIYTYDRRMLDINNFLD